MLDLIPGGSVWEEVVQLAKALEEKGVNLINTGIGWHEARVPTIATMVPRGAFTWVTEKMKAEINTPLVTTNRINTPEVAESILANGQADMVSMARPMLADAEFVNKAYEERSEEINTCIACNQACLDHVFKQKVCSCLVNPRACHETEIIIAPTNKKKKIAVVGAGPAGLGFSITAAEIGHEVHLYDGEKEIGGQFNMAKRIPGKEEFYETLRYYKVKLKKHGVHLHRGKFIKGEELIKLNYDEYIIATGIKPRKLSIEGIELPLVLSYLDVLKRDVQVGNRVAIIGAGGIGFDVAEFLSHNGSSTSMDKMAFMQEWGVDTTIERAGGLRI